MMSAARSAPTVLVDTNVVLDLVLGRAPWAADAALLLDAAARGTVRGFLAGHAVTTMHYIVERETNRATAANALHDLLHLLEVVPLEGADFLRALGLGLRDYEDAVQVVACLKASADYLVTRNAKDFKGTPVTPREPGEVLALLVGRGGD